MNPVLRSRSLLRVTNPSYPSIYRYRRVSPLPWRTYAHSSYGGEGETQAKQHNNPRNSPTRDIEHPGPAPPDVGKKDSNTKASKSQPSTSQEDRDKEDSEGNVRPGVPNDVKKHNEEMKQRYDRSYNQIGDEGKVHKGF